MSPCYIAAVLASIAILIWGLIDILKKRQPKESSEEEVISRQIRGFGMLLLSQMVFVIGGAICFGLAGGADKIFKDVGKLFK